MPTLEANDIIALVAVAVSLIAVTVGPIVTVKVARAQIVAPIRQKWIDELRELISEYLSQCEKLIVLGKDGLLNQEKINEMIFERLLYLEQKLKLLLNPNEEKHCELLGIVSSINDGVQHGVGNLVEFGGQLAGAIEITQKILKEEWIRVKKGAK